MKYNRSHYRRHLLQIGRDDRDVSDEANIAVLAWVVRYFVPYIAEDTPKFCRCMTEGTPFANYVTPSDIAFAVLTLEHHMMKWRHPMQVELETGKTVPPDYSKEANGLLYSNGILGQEAKQRFQDLNVHFFTHFYKRDTHCLQHNVNTLQRFLDALSEGETMDVELQISEEKLGGIPMERIQDDILHRVFYYLYA